MIHLELNRLEKLEYYADIFKISYNKSSTNSRNKVIKELSRYGNLERIGRKYQYTEVYTTPKPKVDNRGKSEGSRNAIVLDFPNFKVEDEYWKSIGIYSITLDNNIYIGSTCTGFRIRFIQHRGKNNDLCTKEMIEDGATFQIIEICDNMTEPEVRELENKYIELYKQDDEWNLMNTNNAWSYEKDYKDSYTTKSIKLAYSLSYLGFNYRKDGDYYKFEKTDNLYNYLNILKELKENNR